jgi:hypothetical protein
MLYSSYEAREAHEADLHKANLRAYSANYIFPFIDHEFERNQNHLKLLTGDVHYLQEV